MPALTIVMPAFNAARFIGAAVRSILDQTYRDFELIIIDDGSTDDTYQIAALFDDPRIRLLRNGSNEGIVYTRNRGIEHASGRYIAQFDADDIAHPDKFRRQLSLLESRPEFGMIGSWAILIDELGNLTGEKWKINAPPERIPAILLFRNYFVQSSVVIRREVIPDEMYRKGFDVVEDYRMWAEVVHQTKTWNYPAYLVYYRIHPESATAGVSTGAGERDAMVYQYIYSCLGMNLTDAELELLNEIKQKTPITEPGILESIEQFLMKINEANRYSGIYNHKQLMTVLFNRWLKSCLRIKGSRHKLFLRLIRSPLTKQLLKNHAGI